MYNVYMQPANPRTLKLIHYLHGSYNYIVAYIWNKFPLAPKSTSTLMILKSQLKHCELRGCQCQSCI